MVGRPVVLVVEDYAEAASVLRRILVLRGYEVALAFDGFDALNILREGLRPAVIVLDVCMPLLDGRSFRDALLADPELADIPVIVYSVDPGRDPLPQIVGHVRKGSDDPDVLLRFIAAAVGGQRSADRFSSLNASDPSSARKSDRTD